MVSKTKGQQLYEIECPTHIRVVLASKAKFATADDVFLVQNPVHHAPWHLITENARQKWERYAEGHHLVTP